MFAAESSVLLRLVWHRAAKHSPRESAGLARTAPGRRLDLGISTAHRTSWLQSRFTLGLVGDVAAVLDWAGERLPYAVGLLWVLFFGSAELIAARSEARARLTREYSKALVRESGEARKVAEALAAARAELREIVEHEARIETLEAKLRVRRRQYERLLEAEAARREAEAREGEADIA